MALQMAQEGALWSCVLIRLGPHWHKVKLKWASIVNQYWMMAANLYMYNENYNCYIMTCIYSGTE